MAEPIYAFVPDDPLLPGGDPILENVLTYLGAREHRSYILERLPELVVKAVN